MTKIVTHNAKFHTDDVFAIATLLLVYPDAEVTRTRDEAIIKTADIVVDVGGVYDPESNRFDHHQPGGAGQRANGIEYASFGLVWKKFGEQVSGSRDVSEIIDRSLAQPIDAVDNGQNIITAVIPEVFPFTISSIIDQYRSTWKEEENWDAKFMEAVHSIQPILKREIKMIGDMVEGGKLIETIYQESEDKKIIIVDEKYDFGRELVGNTLTKFPEPLYAILYRKDTKSWQVLAINKDSGTFELRRALPVDWRAKHGSDLEKVTGVTGATFCHRSGFMCVVKSKEGAINLAKIALNA